MLYICFSLELGWVRLHRYNSKQICIVIKIFRWIQHQFEFRLVLNLSEKRNYNPNLVQISKIPTRFLEENSRYCQVNLSVYLKSIKKVTCDNIGTFPFVYSLVSRTYTVSNVNIETRKVHGSVLGTNQKQVFNFLEIKWFLGSRTGSTCLNSIRIQLYHGNIIDSNHGNGTQPNKDFKVFKKH